MTSNILVFSNEGFSTPITIPIPPGEKWFIKGWSGISGASDWNITLTIEGTGNPLGFIGGLINVGDQVMFPANLSVGPFEGGIIATPAGGGDNSLYLYYHVLRGSS